MHESPHMEPSIAALCSSLAASSLPSCRISQTYAAHSADSRATNHAGTTARLLWAGGQPRGCTSSLTNPLPGQLCTIADMMPSGDG